MAEKKELKYRFYNPNTPEETAELIVKIFMEANRNRMRNPMTEDAAKLPEAGLKNSVPTNVRCRDTELKGSIV